MKKWLARALGLLFLVGIGFASIPPIEVYSQSPIGVTTQTCSIYGIWPQLCNALLGLSGGSTSVSVTAFGAACDGVTDDTAAFQSIAQSSAVLTVSIPQKTCLINAEITTSQNWVSYGGTIKWKTDLGAGVPGINFAGKWFNGINLVGPNGSGYAGIGNTPAQMYGIEDYSNPATATAAVWRDDNAQGFKAGFVLYDNYGHQHLEDLVSTNNYYGIYILNSGQDTKFFDDEITGNTMAGIACAYSADCIASDSVSFSHVGFSPYGIYQEPGPYGASVPGFIYQSPFVNVHFESIGNCAICTRAPQATGMANLTIFDPGFGWNATYQLTTSESYTCTTVNSSSTITGCSSTSGILPGMKVSCPSNPTDIQFGTYVYQTTSSTVVLNRTMAGGHASQSCTFNWDQDYAINIGAGALQGDLVIEQGVNPFTPGATGTIVAAASSGGGLYLNYDYSGAGPPNSSTNLISVADGGTSMYIGADRVSGVKRGFLITISSGASTGTFTDNWQKYMPSNFPIAFGGNPQYVDCAPTSPPATSTPSPLSWGVAVTASGANMTVTVTTDGNVGSNTVFDCHFTNWY